MTERLLQYIWQFQYFNKSLLQTADAQGLEVIHPGNNNTNQGPDFLNAKIKIAGTIWAGSVEIHINTSEWNEHKHSQDKNYNNVILHVVWNNDADLKLSFPTLELKNIVPKILLNKYEGLMQEAGFIACEDQISQIEHVNMTAWKERLLVEKLQDKAINIQQLLQQSNMNWEEVFWWLLSRNFGIKINSESFEKIAQSIPFNLLAKHKSQLIQLEALLLGQAGLLDKAFEEDYPSMLQKEYRFLQQKYKLKKVHAPLYFLRMRPANFPTIRLAQLASLLHNSEHLFVQMKEATGVQEASKKFELTANDYWHYHYVFDELTAFKKKTLGKQMINSILVNTVVPVLYAYGYFNSNEEYKNKAMNWMEQIPSEKNSITEGFRKLNIQNRSAADSQALIWLKNKYCDQKRCLQCTIGNKILKGK
ncbi:DUF2851 family protein [soil metagenome]